MGLPSTDSCAHGFGGWLNQQRPWSACEGAGGRRRKTPSLFPSLSFHLGALSVPSSKGRQKTPFSPFRQRLKRPRCLWLEDAGPAALYWWAVHLTRGAVLPPQARGPLRIPALWL